MEPDTESFREALVVLSGRFGLWDFHLVGVK
jgi:hypothetical protein